MAAIKFKSECSTILREMADDLEAGWFESETIEELFKEIEVSARYHLGRLHGDELKYLAINPPKHSLQQNSLQKWKDMEKRLPNSLGKPKSGFENPEEATAPHLVYSDKFYQ